MLDMIFAHIQFAVRLNVIIVFFHSQLYTHNLLTSIAAKIFSEACLGFSRDVHLPIVSRDNWALD